MSSIQNVSVTRDMSSIHNMNSASGIIFDIKEFAIHDGSGVRTTVFMKGCPLRCVWCHNPEGQRCEPELMQKSGCTGCGKCREVISVNDCDMIGTDGAGGTGGACSHGACSHGECSPFGRCIHSCPRGLLSIAGESVRVDELAERLLRDSDLYAMSGGGVTISGGEPLMQANFVRELLMRLGEAKINCAIETCGYASEETFLSVIKCADFVYCDIKLADSAAHKKYTGVDNTLILRNIKLLQESGIPYKLRVPMIPSITDTKENIDAIRNIIKGINSDNVNDDNVEFLPYNKLAGAKYVMLEREYKCT